MIPFTNRRPDAQSTRGVLSLRDALSETGASVWSPRRKIDEVFIWNARRKRHSQPFTIITIDGGGVSFGYVEEKGFAG